MSEEEKPPRLKVPAWAWVVAFAVIASTFYTRVFN
jgi:hypothetical protein